jgi:hypothetical protein
VNSANGTLSGCLGTSVSCATGDALLLAIIVDLIIGQDYGLAGTLGTGVQGVATSSSSVINDLAISLAEANAFNTANTFLQPQGDFFFASSGHDYTLPNGAPEPNALLLIATALGCMTFFLRRTYVGVLFWRASIAA